MLPGDVLVLPLRLQQDRLGVLQLRLQLVDVLLVGGDVLQQLGPRLDLLISPGGWLQSWNILICLLSTVYCLLSTVYCLPKARPEEPRDGCSQTVLRLVGIVFHEENTAGGGSHVSLGVSGDLRREGDFDDDDDDVYNYDKD